MIRNLFAVELPEVFY